MKSLVWVWVLILIVVGLVGCSGVTPDISPVATPTVPVPTATIQPPATATAPEDPSSLLGVLEWLASGVGAGFLLSIVAQKSAWFTHFGKGAKFALLVGVSCGLPLAATALLRMVPAATWELVQPYWRALGMGILALVSSQIYYQWFVKERDFQQALFGDGGARDPQA